MTNIFNLSDYIVEDTRSEKVGYIHVGWVKEFIRRLHNNIIETIDEKITINKLYDIFINEVGDKLI